MRKVLILAILATFAVAGRDANADQRRAPRLQLSSGQGPVSRLMEMERRKNAALRQMFFNR